MRRFLRSTLGVLGIAAVLCSAVALVTGWGIDHSSSPSSAPKVIHLDEKAAPDGKRVPGGTMTMVQIIEDGGEVGWILILAVGLAMSGVAFWPRKSRPTRR